MVLHVLLLRRSKASLAEVYRRYGDAVFSAARVVADGPTTAEDLTCERFVDLWHNPGTYDPRLGSLGSYLIGGMHGRGSGPVTASGPASVPPAQRPAPLPHPHPVAAHALLERIPAHEGLAIDLALFGHHTCRQIAQLLNEPEKRIRDSIRNGLTRLAGSPYAGQERGGPDFVASGENVW